VVDMKMEVETEMFNKHVRSFLKKSGVDVGVGIRKFAFDLLRKIVMKTPVDTGRARAAWLVSLEKLGEGRLGTVTIPLKPIKKGGKVKRRKGVSASGIALGRTEGTLIDHTKGTFKEKFVIIVNSVDYIVFLEYGWSQQAPYGMVRISMREMRGQKLSKNITEAMIKSWNEFKYV